jgi:hypothetical protein
MNRFIQSLYVIHVAPCVGRHTHATTKRIPVLLLSVSVCLSVCRSVCLSLVQNMSTTSPKRSTLQNLSAYLTLANARDRLGFDPARYGLSEAEAGEIAYVFSTYDVNDDYKLGLSEIRRLWWVLPTLLAPCVRM